MAAMGTWTMLTLASAWAVGAVHAAEPAADPEMRVQRILGTPTFTMNGQPFLLPCFETYTPEERYFRQFAAAGVRLFSFNANVAACDYGHSTPTWVDATTWDYSGFEERLGRVLAATPDAWVLPRLNLGTPRWWLAAHPEEMEVLGDGGVLYQQPNRNPTVPPDRPFPSLASSRWREDMADALRRFIRHVAESPYGAHIAGYILAGLDTEEWYPWSSGSDQLSGYSVPTRQAFRAWLRQKYATAGALQQGWGDPLVTFETAAVPAPTERRDEARGTFRDPARQMNVIDFYLFYNDLVPATIDHFAAIVRQETGGRKAIGAFYGYLYEFRGDPEYGHNALAAYNRSPNLDFIFVTASYTGRASGTGGDYARGPAYSVQLHGKLWYHDNDVASFLAPAVLSRVGMTNEAGWQQNLTHHLQVLGYTETPQKTRWMYRRSLGFALCSGAYESYFDLHGGYYDHPELLDEVRLLNGVAQAAASADRTSVSEILVVSDEASCSYLTFRNDLLGSTLLDTQQRLIKIGAPADHVLLTDLDLIDPARYRLVLFLNTYHMTSEQRDTVRRKLMNGGRHLVWCYAPGTFDGNRCVPDAMQSLTGIRLVPTAGSGPLRIRLTDERTGMAGQTVGSDACRGQRICAVDPAAEVWGRDPETGEPALVRKNMGDWTSWYTATAVLPAALYRSLGRQAGVHLFNDRDDTLYANAGFLAVHANGDGPRTLRFPRESRAVDAITDEALLTAGRTVSLTLAHGETRILRWAPLAAASAPPGE